MKIYGFVLLLILAGFGCGLGPDLSKDRVARSPTPTPFQGEKPVAENVRIGDSAFETGDYATAIASYRLAFDQVQRQQTLDKPLWYSLLTNLPKAYGKTGDLKNARLVLAYAISKESTYPMFHYALARTYADEGNEAMAISYLHRAYKNKASMQKGEKIPDPLADDSFASFADSETFKKAAADLKAGKGL